MCSLFATTYPERTRALVMIGTYAKRLWAPDYPWAPDAAAQASGSSTRSARNWGGPVGIEARAPSRAADPAFRSWWSNYLRQGASPGAALTLTQMNAEIDVRNVLPLVRVPTLVLHRTGDRTLLVEEGRYVASTHPGRAVRRAARRRPPAVCRRSGRDARRDRGVPDVGRPRRAPRIACSPPCCAPASTATVPQPSIGRGFETHVQRRSPGSGAAGLAFTAGGFLRRLRRTRRARSACARALRGACPRFGRGGSFGLHTGECDLTPEGRVAGAAFERARAVCGSPPLARCWSRAR